MNDTYPFLDKIRSLTEEKNEGLQWLAGEIDMSKRWIEKITSVEDVRFGLLVRISNVLEFDFISDYHKWKGAKTPRTHELAEPKVPYQDAVKDPITINLTISGDVKDLTSVINKIKQETKKLGYRVG